MKEEGFVGRALLLKKSNKKARDVANQSCFNGSGKLQKKIKEAIIFATETFIEYEYFDSSLIIEARAIETQPEACSFVERHWNKIKDIK